MRIDIVKSLIALAISALLAYACYEICDFNNLRWFITLGSFVTILIPLLLAMGITSKDKRGGLSLKFLSWIVASIEIAANAFFVFFDFSVPVYIIINGLILVLFALIYHSIYNTHM